MTKEQIIATETVLVDVSKLKGYDKNPRKGNVKAIAESLKTNSQYRPIVVQKSSMKILAGNHTWKAAKELGWKKIAVVFVDVDDEGAKRIVLADNRTNDLAEYDNEILAELLKDLGTGEGTGYSEDDMNAIFNAVAADAETVMFASHEAGERALSQDDELTSVGIGLGGSVRDEDDEVSFGEEEDDEEQELEKQADDLAGVYTLKDEMQFPTSTFWEIPYLREDMMIETLPEDFKTWAGSASRDDPHEGYWLYNWGIDSTSGMKDLSKIFLSFYAWDEYFEAWWDYPARHMSKVLNAKIKYAITPNFTQGGMDRALSLYNLYRSRWIGRYLQEIGVKVMPDLEMRDEPEFIQIALKSLPKRVPWASIQIQNLDAKTRGGRGEDPDLRKQWVKDTRTMLGKANIENLLIYANPNRTDEISEWLDGTGVGTKFMPTRLSILSKKVKDNSKASDRL